MVTIIKKYDESKVVDASDIKDVDWHEENSERFEFHSTSLNQETGVYDSVFTVDDCIVAEKPGIEGGVWMVQREQMPYVVENWDEMSNSEKEAQMEAIEEFIPRIEGAQHGKIKVVDVNVERIPTELTPCGNLGEICETLALEKDFEKRLFIIEGYMDGMVGKQTFGISFYKPPGNKGGGFLNLWRKRKGLPENFAKKWENLKIKTTGNKPSSMVAMKSYNDEWNWGASVLQFFEEHSDIGNGELTFEQICSEFPNYIMVKLFNFAK